MVRLGRVVGLLGAGILLAGCSSLATYEVVMPSGVRTTTTAAVVAQRTLESIAENERGLGHAIEPARIVRVRLLGPGEWFEPRRLDGTSAGAERRGSSDGGPAWFVEAIGTFYHVDKRTGQVDSRGYHGWFEWDENGEPGSSGYLECWNLPGARAGDREGSCP
jgi:hypothetical protein